MVSVSLGKDSKQDYRTPLEFMEVIRKRFGPIVFDLAAHKLNTQHLNYFSIDPTDKDAYGYDAFAHDWADLSLRLDPGVLWLNPPFNRIGPWAQRCMLSQDRLRQGSRILLLAPAAVGSNWFDDYCFDIGNVNFLKGRLSFDGKSPFPKDCMIVEYERRPILGDHDYDRTISVWNWRKWT